MFLNSIEVTLINEFVLIDICVVYGDHSNLSCRPQGVDYYCNIAYHLS